MNNEQKKEEVIIEALELLEQGVPESSILDKYPSFKSDLAAVFETTRILKLQKNVVPPEKLLRSALDKLPAGVPIRSPYHNNNDSSRPVRSFFSFQKFGAVSIMFVVLVVGGIFLSRYKSDNSGNNVTQITQSTGNESHTLSASDTDAALEQDMNTIDTQMKGLSSDNANTDRALSQQSS